MTGPARTRGLVLLALTGFATACSGGGARDDAGSHHGFTDKGRPIGRDGPRLDYPAPVDGLPALETRGDGKTVDALVDGKTATRDLILHADTRPPLADTRPSPPDTRPPLADTRPSPPDTRPPPPDTRPPPPDAGPSCSPATCSGCCTVLGMCNPGTTQDACGKGGVPCAGCPAGTSCHLQTCCTPQCAGKQCGVANGCGGTCVPGSGCLCPPKTHRQGTQCVPHPTFSIPIPTRFNTSLQCYIPWSDSLSPTPLVGMVGTEIASVVGLDPSRSAIGARFELKRVSNPNYVDVLETRSGAGAAWQTSHLGYDATTKQVIVFNQAAGNSVRTSAGVPYQWAYNNTVSVDTKAHQLHALAWNPVSSDHVHGGTEHHTPCSNRYPGDTAGYCLDDGKPDVFGYKISTAHGTALLWIHAYTYRSRMYQHWPSWILEQALYLKRGIARSGNLRLYLRKGSTKYGPFRIYDTYDIKEGSTSTCTHKSDGSTFCDHSQGYDYAVLVWNIFGLDIGIAIPDLQKGTSINLEKQAYCHDPKQDTCGNISFHSWLARETNATFLKNSIRTYANYYYVGTRAQLADLGYETW